MTQNSTLPEDGQPKCTDNADQHLSSGPGQETLAAAPGQEQETACPASGADTDEQHPAADCPCAAPHAGTDSRPDAETGASPDVSPEAMPNSRQEQPQMHEQSCRPGEAHAGHIPADGSQAAGTAKKRGVFSSWRGKNGRSTGAATSENVVAAGIKAAMTPPEPNAAQKFFETASRVGPFFLLLLLLAQAWPAFMGNALYCPREAESIFIFSQTSQSGLWLAPAAPGLAHWPVYHWYLAGMQSLVALAGPGFGHLLFPMAGLAGALLCLMSVWTLARVAGLGAQAALAGGMILLSAPLFVPMAHFTGPESLATALTLFSLALLCHGWQKPHAWVSLPAGFILAGLAGLTGGIFQLMLPLVTSVFFLSWRGTFRRAQGMDGVTGFVLLLLLLACWLGGVMLWQQPEGYLKFLGERLILWPWPSAQWWLPLLVAAAGLLPWAAIMACVSWVRVLRTAPADLAASRKERSGIAFLWISLAVACVLSLAAYDPASAALTIICLAAPLLGKALLRLSGLGGRLFFIFAALCLLHAGMALVAAGFGPTLDWMGGFFKFSLSPEQREMVLGLKALPILGSICIVAAVLLSRMVRKGAHGGMGGALLICAVIVILLAQPGTMLLGPQLKTVPQAQLRHLDELLHPQAAPAIPAPAVKSPEAAAPAPEETTSEPAAPETGVPQPDTAAPADTASPVEKALEKAASEAAAYDARAAEEIKNRNAAPAQDAEDASAASSPATVPGAAEIPTVEDTAAEAAPATTAQDEKAAAAGEDDAKAQSAHPEEPAAATPEAPVAPDASATEKTNADNASAPEKEQPKQ
ncbi:hypothetical protein [Desulfovibrio sp.]|uniref:ArnT family glycosyltransferase n=1 Tax=Desulfovibrio sp. TaxID=885 RepID=UPI0025C648CA|nr:hypothetical protein [Desulfovibrio sp.]